MRRRAGLALNGAEGAITEADIDRIWKAQKCKCAICKVKLREMSWKLITLHRSP